MRSVVGRRWRRESGGKDSRVVAKKFRWGAKSITNKRDNNEDRFMIDPDGRYFIVADGMGGQAAGERASEMASEIVPVELEKRLEFKDESPETVESAIKDAISHANADIMTLAAIDVNSLNMGTTIVLAVAVGDSLYVAGVGDSRVYRFADDKLLQLTKDHSLTQALVDAGTISEEDAKTHRFKNVLHRYLGSKEGNNGAEVKMLPLTTGHRYLLCSDGVNEGVEDDQIAEILKRCAEPQQAADELVQASQDGGANDNITCVVVYVD
ncbi:Serine/threonine phosphatase stp [Symmachiella dynata]|uniref:Serine/threonine phosphatase stp n=1 Tax=Symmachiella dynata TaxID=2527995 RepID=A0A517ZJC5_9PLAN|nr:Serine/threonine phosphatase stp [Symmachiella dynata]